MSLHDSRQDRVQKQGKRQEFVDALLPLQSSRHWVRPQIGESDFRERYVGQIEDLSTAGVMFPVHSILEVFLRSRFNPLLGLGQQGFSGTEDNRMSRTD